MIRLMREKPFEKFSIQEIAKKSGVGRATWFRNYNGKNEALTFKLIVLWNRWSDEHDISVRDRCTLKNSKDFFEFNFEIRCIVQTIYSANMQSAVYDAFYQVMMPQYGANAEECYKARFYSYGLFGLLDEWVKRGFKETPDEMVRIFYTVMDVRSDI